MIDSSLKLMAESDSDHSNRALNHHNDKKSGQKIRPKNRKINLD